MVVFQMELNPQDHRHAAGTLADGYDDPNRPIQTKTRICPGVPVALRVASARGISN